MITITHTRAAGTLIEGSSKGDGVYEILKGLYGNWRYFPSLRQIGIGQSRDKTADTYKINRATEALRTAGHEVTVDIDDTVTRTFAEVEAERYERADDRAGRFEEYAENAAGRSQAAWERSHQIAGRFEGGQPILVGHHSERRARADQRRMHDAMSRSVAEDKKAGHWSDRAEAAGQYQERRESVPTTLRRIEKLEAEQRLIQRRLDGTDEFMNYGKPASGDYRERLAVRMDEIGEELAYWREHVARREAEGVKVWSRDDFAKGDFVNFGYGWYEVLRVNAKSVSVPAMLNNGPVVTKVNARLDWSDTITYDKVRGRKSADEMASIMAEAERRQSA